MYLVCDIFRDVIKGKFKGIFLNGKNQYPQPTLEPRTSDAKGEGLNHFYFGSPIIKFTGRNEEIGRLGKFLRKDKPFMWWLFTEPGDMVELLPVATAGVLGNT